MNVRNHPRVGTHDRCVRMKLSLKPCRVVSDAPVVRSYTWVLAKCGN